MKMRRRYWRRRRGLIGQCRRVRSSGRRIRGDENGMREV
jgi:hypothetical protein